MRRRILLGGVKEVQYLTKYFTIVSLNDNNTIGWKAYRTNLLKTISVSTDNGSTWTSKTSSTEGTQLAVLNNGQKLLIKGSNTSYGNSSYYNCFTSTANFNVEGNIMSLVYGDNFDGQTTLNSSGYNFRNLFRDCTLLISAENLILPATTLAPYCYQYMFLYCSSLTTAPELPATTLANYCYQYMLSGCSSLTTAPELPATTLANYCYASMLEGCSSLTTAPELPATTLAPYCYASMLSTCTSLTTAPELPVTTLANYCYQWMFYGCTSLTTAPELPATTLTIDCYNAMFRGCSSLTTAPELPATTLANYCYEYMFYGCTSLTTAPDLPATTLATNCYQYMFYGCTSLTTAPELPATTLVNYCYRQMFYNCSRLNSITCLATSISASRCTNGWVSGVDSSGTFKKAAMMSSWKTGTDGIPSGWTVVNA